MAATTPSSFTCPRCGATSHHPDDVEQGYCGRCHAWTRVSLRCRLYIDGKKADEVWLTDEAEMAQVGQRHQTIAEDAERAGMRWMVEVFDPAAPHEVAFLRFGTDRAGMVEPQVFDKWPWET